MRDENARVHRSKGDVITMYSMDNSGVHIYNVHMSSVAVGIVADAYRQICMLEA